MSTRIIKWVVPSITPGGKTTGAWRRPPRFKRAKRYYYYHYYYYYYHYYYHYHYYHYHYYY
jgi:hypothetical protein